MWHLRTKEGATWKGFFPQGWGSNLLREGEVAALGGREFAVLSRLHLWPYNDTRPQFPWMHSLTQSPTCLCGTPHSGALQAEAGKYNNL